MKGISISPSGTAKIVITASVLVLLIGSIDAGLSAEWDLLVLFAFLIFSDYARNPIRLSALMEIPVIHIFTHDSIGVGEDGLTHQPVEQILSLRRSPISSLSDRPTPTRSSKLGK